jgi:WXG100 family type VII secretion target
MAAERIKLNASDANSAVRTIKGKASEAQSTVNQLQKEVNNVKTWWEGNSSVAFVDEFNKSKKEFDKMIDCINKYGDLLTKAIKIQQDADAEIARQMRSGG